MDVLVLRSDCSGHLTLALSQDGISSKERMDAIKGCAEFWAEHRSVRQSEQDDIVNP